MTVFAVDIAGTGVEAFALNPVLYVTTDITDFGQSRQLDFDGVNDRFMEVGFFCLGATIGAGVDGLVGGIYWAEPHWLMFEHQQVSIVNQNGNFYDHVYFRLAAGVTVHMVGYEG